MSVPILEPDVDQAIDAVSAILEYEFKDSGLLGCALCHSSFIHESGGRVSGNNERLEFLGDAVIGLVVAELLMEKFVGAPEGELSRWRSGLVSRKALAGISDKFGFSDWVLLGKGERLSGGTRKRSILSGAFEAIVGALYVDAGIEVARGFLVKVYQPWLEVEDPSTSRLFDMADCKTYLQEITQSKYRSIPIYRLAKSWGKEHDKRFRVEIEINGQVVASGEGCSKKEAEQDAAGAALTELGL